MKSLRDWSYRVLGRPGTPEPDSSRATIPRAGSDSGETLIEVLLALIILALASVALITAFGTDISASAEHRSLANFDTALASSIATTTTLIQQQYASVFATCPNPLDPLAAYPTSAAMTSALNISGYTATIEASGSLPAVEYSDGSGFTPTCTTGTPNTPSDVDQPQLITIVVTDTQTGYSQVNSVVVDDPTPVQVSGGNGSAATQLVFVTEPEGATVGTPFTTQPILEVQDSSGTIVTTDLSPITLTLSGGTNGAALSSTCSGIESSGIVVFSGCSINEVGTGYQLTASEPSPTQPGQFLSTPSTVFSVYSAPLATPVITKVTPSTVTQGAINVTFSGSANAPANQTYTIKACTNSSMSANCTTPANFTSGNDLTGLTPGTNYWVQITAAATSNYLPSTSPPKGPTMATVQLNAPGAPSLGYGTAAGSLAVSFAPPTGNVPSGQTYTVKACTNSAMMSGCVSNTNFTSGASFTGLPFIAGSPGTLYYVQVTANASTGYLASAPSPSVPVPASSSHNETSAVQTPTSLTAAPSSQTGAITVSFNASGGVTKPTSYTATACTDQGMSLNCVTVTNFTSGAQVSGLIPGDGYYVEITAVAPNTAYASATTAPTSSAAVATVQLAAPTNVAGGYGTNAGSLSVTFSPPVPAAPGQTYTVKACTNTQMTAGCVSNGNFNSGSQFSNLPFTPGTVGTTYYIQVTANGSSGYLVSPVSGQASHAEESQIGAPGAPTAVSSTTATGTIVVSFANSSGPAPSSYTAVACTNIGMNNPGCVTANNYTSGAPFGGLTPGTQYYVQITAVGPTGYANDNSAVSTSSTVASVQLAAPTNVTGGYGTTAGSLSVNFSAPNPAAPGQTYTVKACTNTQMNAGCVSSANFNSGSQFSGLPFTPGTVGTTYYIQVTANGSPGYFVSPTSSQANHAEESQYNPPGTPTVATSTRNGDISVSFSAPAGAAPGSYTAEACPTQAISAGCVGPQSITPGVGVLLGGLRAGSSYYVQITAVASAAYVSSVSAFSSGAARAG